MARLALGVAGAGVGFLIGGPAGAQIGFGIGTAVGGVLFPTQLPDSQGPRIEDLVFGGSSYGVPIIKSYGKIRAPGTVIWGTDIKETATVEQVGGGKGGGSSQANTTFSYSANVAVMFGEGVIDEVLRIWAHGKLIYNLTDSGTVATAIASRSRWSNMVIYPGNETQLPDPTIESFEGVGNVNANRGNFYIVFSDLQLADFGNGIPNFTCEFTDAATASVVLDAGYPPGIEGGTPSVRNFLDGHGLGLAKCPVALIDGTATRFYVKQEAADINTSFVSLYIYRETAGNIGENTKTRVDTGIVGNYFNIATTHFNRYSPEGRIWDAGIWDNDNEFFYFADFTRGIFKRYAGPAKHHDALFDVKPIAYIGEFAYLSINKSVDFDLYRLDVNTGAFVLLDTNALTQNWVGGGSLTHFVSYTTEGANTMKVYINGETTPDQTFINPWTAGSDPGAEGTSVIVKEAGIYTAYAGAFWQRSRYDSIADVATDLGQAFMSALGSTFFYTDDVFHGLAADDAPDIPNYSRWGKLEVAQGAAPTLQSIVGNIVERSGLVAGDYDVTALSGTVTGYAITRQMSSRAALEPLLRTFNFNGVESDNKLKFVPYGGSPAATITDDDLGSQLSVGNTLKLAKNRKNELEIPRRVEITYLDPDRDYDQNMQYDARIITVSSLVKKINASTIVLSAPEARQLAQIDLLNEWTARDQFEWTLSFKFMKLDATDVIDITSDGTTYRILITVSKNNGAFLSMSGILLDPATLTSTLEGESGQHVINNQVGLGGPTILRMLNIKTLRGVDSDPTLYFVVFGISGDWGGAVIYSADSGSEDFTRLISTTVAGVLGVALEALTGDGNPNLFNGAQSLDVQMIGSGTLSSAADDLAVLNGANVFALGNDVDGYEIIQFRDAVDNMDGSFTISRFLRARRGTEHLMSGHAEGDSFILLSGGGTSKIDMSVNEIGKNKSYIATSIGQLFDPTNPQSFAYDGENLKPISPVHARGTRDGSDNFTGTFVRRARANTEWIDGADVPLDEDSESYEIDVLDTGVVQRTIAVTAETFSYTAAEQTTDFGSAQSSIDFEIFQLSAQVGRGDVLAVTL